MRKFIILIFFVSVSTNLILPSRVFKVETGEVFALQSVNSEDAAYIESVMGCSLKCVDTCFQFTKGMAAVQCTQQCGCKDLLTPIPTTQLFSDFSIEVATPKSTIDDWDIDITINEDTQINVETGTKQTGELTQKSHAEVDIAGNYPDMKEFTYSNVETESYNSTDGLKSAISHSEWTNPGGELSGSSDSVEISDEYANSEKTYVAELPNQDAQVVYKEEIEVELTNDYIIVEENRQAEAVKNKTDPYTRNTNTSGLGVEYETSTEFSGEENSGSIYKEEEISWHVIDTISARPAFRDNDECQAYCSGLCVELKGGDDCMTTCKTTFCETVPVQVETSKPKAETFRAWAWVISIAIFGIAVVVFFKKFFGAKSRVIADFNESSASYKILA